MMKRMIQLMSLCAVLALGSLSANGQAQPQAEWVAALRDGGHVIVLRHGATHPDQANTARQPQLTDQSRELTRTIGDSIRKLKIPVGQVHTSVLDRAVETGTLLGFGPVVSGADVSEGGTVASPNASTRHTQAMRKLAATAPPPGTNVIVVSHKPNIMAVFGKDWSDVSEGEASVFKPDGAGGYKLVVRVQAADWAKLAAAN